MNRSAFRQLTLPAAIAAALCGLNMTAPSTAWAVNGQSASWAVNGKWMSGDFHQHTYYTDGSNPFDTVMEMNDYYGLDWWANSEHGGSRNRNGEGEYWDAVGITPQGDDAQSGGHPVMWRWESLRDFVWQDILRNRDYYPTKKIFSGLEWNVPGHEHCSTGIVADDASAISAFEFMFDASDHDTSREGETTPYGKLTKSNGEGKTYPKQHQDAVAACRWMQKQKDKGRIDDGWIIFAHIERDGVWTKENGGGYNVEHFRDFNNAGPDVCFGFEGAPGHQTSGGRGGFGLKAFGGTWGGAGYYTATVGGLWDALLGEGRRWFNFASSDFHDHFTDGGSDFWPGEYQKDWVYVEDKNNDGDYSYTEIVDGMRSGNSFHVMGDLIDALEFTAASGSEEVAMGGELTAKKKRDLVITIRFKSPRKNTCKDYPDLAADCPKPKVDHIDLIAGEITGIKQKGTPEYSNASNPSTHVVASFTKENWTTDSDGYNVITYVVDNLDKDMYFRLRGTNLAPNTPCETDPAGNPLTDFAASTCDSNLDGAQEAYADLWFYSNPIFVYSGR